MPRGHPGTELGPHGTHRRYCQGPCRCAPCTEGHRRYMIRWQLSGPRTTDALITRRKLQSLAALGWSYPQLARRLGVTTPRIGHLTRAVYSKAHADTVKAVDDLYRDLQMTPPPATTRAEQYAITRAKASAVRNGWVPPLAWDDIDDPDATPDLSTVAQAKTLRTYRVDTDEWVYLVRAGENPERAAERLGVHIDAVEMAFRRADDVTTWHRYRRTA